VGLEQPTATRKKKKKKNTDRKGSPIGRKGKRKKESKQNKQNKPQTQGIKLFKDRECAEESAANKKKSTTNTQKINFDCCNRINFDCCNPFFFFTRTKLKSFTKKHHHKLFSEQLAKQESERTHHPYTQTTQ
jgi:hypothetical protein